MTHGKNKPEFFQGSFLSRAGVKKCRFKPKNSERNMKKICILFSNMAIIANEEKHKIIDISSNMYTKIGEKTKKRFFQVLYKILGDFILTL